MAQLLSTNVAGTLNVSSNVLSNGVQLLAPSSLTSVPDISAANTLQVYSRNIANQMLMYVNTPTANNTNFDPDAAVQPFMGSRLICSLSPQFGTVNTSCFTNQGIAWNVTANTANASVQPGNGTPILKNSMRRVQLGANNSVGGNAWLIANCNTVWGGGSTSNGGGYLAVIRGSVDLSGSLNNKTFFGMFSNTAPITTELDPVANVKFNLIGLACNANATNNWAFVTSGAAGITVTGLGANFNYNFNDVLELTIYVPPGAGSVGYRVRNLSNGAETQGINTTNIPAANVFMQPCCFIQNNGAGVAACSNISLMSIYIEPQY